MNRLSKLAVAAGIAVQLVTIITFLLIVRPLSGMALICLCFILFAELELVGTIALIPRFQQTGVSAGLRLAIGLISGVYSCVSIVLSLSFVPYDIGYLRALLWMQILLLLVLLIADSTVFSIFRHRQSPSKTVEQEQSVSEP